MLYVHSHVELVSRHFNAAIKFSLDQWDAVTLNNERVINWFPLSITSTIDPVLVMTLVCKHTYSYWNDLNMCASVLLMLKTLR